MKVFMNDEERRKFWKDLEALPEDDGNGISGTEYMLQQRELYRPQYFTLKAATADVVHLFPDRFGVAENFYEILDKMMVEPDRCMPVALLTSFMQYLNKLTGVPRICWFCPVPINFTSAEVELRRQAFVFLNGILRTVDCGAWCGGQLAYLKPICGMIPGFSAIQLNGGTLYDELNRFEMLTEGALILSYADRIQLHQLENDLIPYSLLTLIRNHGDGQGFLGMRVHYARREAVVYGNGFARAIYHFAKSPCTEELWGYLRISDFLEDLEKHGDLSGNNKAELMPSVFFCLAYLIRAMTEETAALEQGNPPAYTLEGSDINPENIMGALWERLIFYLGWLLNQTVPSSEGFSNDFSVKKWDAVRPETLIQMIGLCDKVTEFFTPEIWACLIGHLRNAMVKYYQLETRPVSLDKEVCNVHAVPQKVITAVYEMTTRLGFDEYFHSFCEPEAPWVNFSEEEEK